MKSAIQTSFGRAAVADFLCVWALFLAYSWLHAPPPATGEPHYLSKARHFHDPAWCRGDLFLESADTHLAFHIVFGWPLRFVSPEATIVFGRVVGLAISAVGWTCLSRTLIRFRTDATPFDTAPFGTGLAAASVYCVFASAVNLSGEWMLDGIEGRVVGYGFLFLGWAAGLQHRPRCAAAALGSAVAFHPVVGTWGLGAGLGGLLFARWRSWSVPVETTVAPDDASPNIRDAAADSGWKRLRRGSVVAATFALPASVGVLPALSVVGGVDGPKADELQVFYRLAHHLDPTTFDRGAWIAYAVILLSWLIARRWDASAGPFRRTWWFGCVVTSLTVFAVGVAAGWGPRPATDENFPLKALRTRVLKFYPFRLADTLVPVAATFTLTSLAGRAIVGQPKRTRAALATAAVALTIGIALSNGWRTRVRPPIAPWRIAAWRDVCRWVKANTPPDSVFITPQVSWAFKWFAERPEHVTYKDCPQDPASLVEWNRRLLLLDAWATDEFHDGFSVEALRRLRRATGATHLLARDLGPFAVEPIYRNEIYQIIVLPD